MHIATPLLVIGLAVTALAASPTQLSRRQVSCTTEDGSTGVCASTSTTCNGMFVEGLCAGAGQQCCVATPETTAVGEDGDDEVDTPDDGVIPVEESKKEAEVEDRGVLARRQLLPRGHRVYAAARRWLGTKYVKGGGNCAGPTKGGFDSSGLVLHAVCLVTGKDLPHSAHLQYHSRLGRKIPRAQAQRGDTVYWATNGNCRTSVKFVALVKNANTILSPPRGKTVREQRLWLRSGSLVICPYAVRF